VGATIFNVDVFQGMMINLDIVDAALSLVNDAVVILNTTSTITKINKSAEIMFNTASSLAVGKQITEFLSNDNSSFYSAYKE
jgi:sensor histidine kinase regulating citrate/malate metabolism